MDQRRKMANDIEILINRRDHILFTDIEAHVPGFMFTETEPCVVFGGAKSILWGATRIGCQAVLLLLDDQRICLCPTLIINYLITSKHLNFIQDPAFLPMGLRPKRFSNFANPTTKWLFCLEPAQLNMAKETIASRM